MRMPLVFHIARDRGEVASSLMYCHVLSSG